MQDKLVALPTQVSMQQTPFRQSASEARMSAERHTSSKVKFNAVMLID